jgi:hypothetical protein
MNTPVPPTILGSYAMSNADIGKTKGMGTILSNAEITSAKIQNAEITNAEITNADITNATIVNETTVYRTQVLSLGAENTTQIPITIPSELYKANTFYYRFNGMIPGVFNTIFIMEQNRNYYCIGNTAADNDNAGPPVIFMAYSVFQVGNFISPIIGNSEVRLNPDNNSEVQVMSHGTNYLGLNMIITVFGNVGS